LPDPHVASLNPGVSTYFIHPKQPGN